MIQTDDTVEQEKVVNAEDEDEHAVSLFAIPHMAKADYLPVIKALTHCTSVPQRVANCIIYGP